MHTAAQRVQPIQIKPESAQESNALPRGTIVRPNSSFEVVHYHNWFFDERGGDEPGDGEWLPNLGKLNHTPGANGVALVNGQVNPHGARVGVSQKGGILISPTNRLLGSKFGDYLARYKVKGGGYYHVYSWIRFTVLGGGRAVPDHAANAPITREFHRHVYKVGIVPMMAREQLDEKIVIHNARLQAVDAMFRKGDMDADTHERIHDEHSAKIDQWTRAFERLHGIDAADHGTKAAAPERVAITEPATDAIGPIKAQRGKARK